MFDDIRNFASTMIGWPYSLGGRTKEGIDCLGLVIYLYKNFYGIDIPDAYVSCGSEATKILDFYGTMAEPQSKPTVGCIVYIENPNDIDHLGVSLGGDKYLSVSRKHGVYISRLPIHNVRFFKVRS